MLKRWSEYGKHTISTELDGKGVDFRVSFYCVKSHDSLHQYLLIAEYVPVSVVGTGTELLN